MGKRFLGVIILLLLASSFPTQALRSIATAKPLHVGVNSASTSPSTDTYYFNFSAEETVLYEFLVESDAVNFLFMVFFDKHGSHIAGTFARALFTIGGHDFYIIRLTKEINSGDGRFNITIEISGEFTETIETAFSGEQPPPTTNTSLTNQTTDTNRSFFQIHPLPLVLLLFFAFWTRYKSKT